MNLRQLHIFVSIAKQGSITKAAKELYMTQPALSHALHDLEEELHMQLFDRVGKRLVLNRQGAYIAKKAEAVLCSFEDLQKSSKEADTYAHLNIASCITIAAAYLPQVLPSFQSVYPDLPLHIDVISAREVIKKVLQKEVDIALVEGVIKEENLAFTTFHHYELVIVCAKTHPLIHEDIVSIHEIIDETWLLREKGSAVRDAFDALLEIHSCYLQPYWTSVDSQALLEAITQGLGISILPDVVVEQYAQKDKLHCLRLKEGPIYNEMHMVHLKGRDLYPSEQTLLKYLKMIS